MVGDLQRQMRVLLDEEDGHALLVDLLDDVEDGLHHGRRQAERWLVEEQEPGSRHQGARDRQHLLLAAGQRAGHLRRALLEDGEELEALLHVLRDALRVAPQEGAQEQVFRQGQVGKDAPTFGCVTEPARYEPVRLEPADGCPLVPDLPRGGPQHSAYRAQGRGLAGAVRADQRDDLSLADPDGDAAEGMDRAVVHVERLQLEQRFCHQRGLPAAAICAACSFAYFSPR